MHYTYILRSQRDPSKLYIGSAKDLKTRLNQHNQRLSTYSKIYAPWFLEAYVAFQNETLARNFERYLKSGSGHAFLKKRLLPK